ncbi:MAG TPA: hypothetical protein VI932_05615, partial [Bacteroidota bacterium]|nr:hypothetical protein [Bacteroidota bacterium]
MIEGLFRWYRILQERDVRRIRRNAILGVYIPMLAGVLVFTLLVSYTPAAVTPVSPELGGMSGGGGGDRKEYEMEFGSTAGGDETATESPVKSVEVHLVKIRFISPSAPAAKPAVKRKIETRKKQLASAAGPPPVRRLRGAGPGSGGGAGGGSGGGIGAGVGY